MATNSKSEDNKEYLNGKRGSFAGFQTNSFWSNWEVSAGFGIGTAVSTGPDLGEYGKRLGFQGDFSLTKWLHPVVGLRGQLQGGKFSNFHPEYGKMKWPYLFAHADVMINLSNWIGGYRDDRVYYAVPYAGGGYMTSNFTDKSQKENHYGTSQQFALAFGLLNKFRVSKAFDINLEFKGLWAKSNISPAQMSGRHLIGLSTTLGVTYRFKHRTWERAIAASAVGAEIAAYQKAAEQSKAELDNAKAENEKLNKELADAKAAAAKAAEPVIVKEEVNNNASMSVLFYCGSTRISVKEQTRLKLIVAAMKEAPADKKFTLVGHADSQTGTPEFNKRIAEKRAKVVYDYLVKEGIDADRMTYKGVGDTMDINPYPAANRAVTIE